MLARHISEAKACALPAGSQAPGSHHIAEPPRWFQAHDADHFISHILPRKTQTPVKPHLLCVAEILKKYRNYLSRAAGPA